MHSFNEINQLLTDCINLQDNLLDKLYLLANEPKTVELLKTHLTQKFDPLLLHLIKQFPEAIKISLLPEIINIMQYLDGNTKLCQEIILSINTQWLEKHIWNYITPILGQQDYQTFGILMYLFNSFSQKLSKKLANLALQSDDKDVQEIGEFYLSNNRYLLDDV
ncbi:hypothetical protein A9G29_04910 [Gilliamella sp. Fer2-1]|jgi:hypothetical protein|uniref:hypothetical protein n=2 Tax=unclassified Gilliamella TaxID=2685620 RepID=UPI00080E0A7C|nr:hypothetical protein [Gilliamella apicola]OCG19048.1 hypothetical protein A9G47_05250 [Gilliamella apicola]OCG33065.1 hypothetical protein A9G29_04910 [Gilliamella apicola]